MPGDTNASSAAMPAGLSPPERSRRKKPAVTVRALVLGSLLIPFHVYWIITVEGIYHWNHCTAVSLYWNVVFNLLILLGVNALLKRYLPRWALTQAEFVTIYVMIAVAS
ncbi:MAG: hypothetical protein J7M26_01725, partial [Armatimonadetes bacterium]|nr:hypothetical protein [Armatimonadota bacterium]